MPAESMPIPEGREPADVADVAAPVDARDDVAVWTRILDELEQLLASGHPLGDGSDAAWRPPAAVPPLPPELLDRAVAVRRAQDAAITAARDARRAAGERLAAAPRSRPAGGASSVYLDTTA